MPRATGRGSATDDQAIGEWLEELASAAPAPGGGAAAALEAATAAALVEMVCNLTIGKPAYAAAEATMLAARERAGAVRARALALAGADADAFRAVIDAYRLPKDANGEPPRRREAIQRALAGAAEVPRETAEAATEVLALAESVLAGANPNVVSDVAAAAAAARAALATALVNVEINRAAISDETLRAALAEAAAGIERELGRADALLAAVRERLGA